MKSRAAIAGHPLHPIFVTIPVGLWTFAPVCDLIYHAGWGPDSWNSAALYCLAGGLAGAVPAFVTGYIDYGLIRDAKAAAVAKFHLYLNVTVIVLMAISVWLRWREVSPAFSLVPVAISVLGFLMVSLSGYLGGELVSRFGVSVTGVPDGGLKEK